jgi:hypothetical protein
MKYHFDSHEWGITPSEQIYRCYLLAEEGRRIAKTAPPKLARIYEALADQWAKLGNEIAATVGKSH